MLINIKIKFLKELHIKYSCFFFFQISDVDLKNHSRQKQRDKRTIAAVSSENILLHNFATSSSSNNHKEEKYQEKRIKEQDQEQEENEAQDYYETICQNTTNNNRNLSYLKKENNNLQNSKQQIINGFNRILLQLKSSSVPSIVALGKVTKLTKTTPLESPKFLSNISPSSSYTSEYNNNNNNNNNNSKSKETVMNTHATTALNLQSSAGQTSVVGHHRGFSQPTAANSGDPWFLQSTGHQMPPTAPARQHKRPAPQPGTGGGGGGGVPIGGVLLQQQQHSQSQPHIVPPTIPPHQSHQNNVVV